MSELSPKAEARAMELAATLSRCEPAGTLGRFPSDSGKTQSHLVGLWLLPSLRSKLPRCPLLRASFQRVFSRWLAISPLSRSPQVCTIWSRDWYVPG